MLFTTPNAPFLSTVDETILDIAISGGNSSEVQIEIEKYRSLNPNAFLRFRFTSSIKVNVAPIRISSMMCLILSEASGIMASSGESNFFLNFPCTHSFHWYKCRRLSFNL